MCCDGSDNTVAASYNVYIAAWLKSVGKDF